jgi:hypothetical protein
MFAVPEVPVSVTVCTCATDVITGVIAELYNLIKAIVPVL